MLSIHVVYGKQRVEVGRISVGPVPAIFFLRISTLHWPLLTPFGGLSSVVTLQG